MRNFIRKFTFTSYILTIFFLFVFSFLFASSLKLDPLTRNYYRNSISWYSIDLKIDTQNFSVYAVDFKFFLSWFTYQSFNLQADFLNDWWTYNFLTWVSTSWSQAWRNYYYINAYKLNTVQLNPYNDVRLWTLNLWYASWYLNKTWYVDFYYIWPNVNFDDSNIASWIENNTKYVDILDVVSWWAYTFLWEIPWIISWYYSQYTLQDSWSVYTAVFKNVLAWFLFGNVNDLTRTNRTQSTWWSVWTNTAVTLDLLFDKDAMILTWSSEYSWVIDITDNNRSTGKTLSIKNNIQTWILFENNGEIWSWYSYTFGTGKFWIDVFWIDTTPSILTWYITWENIFSLKTFYNLSWFNTWVNWTMKDDEFKILNFSWEIPVTTNYLSWTNNIFSMTHFLEFNDERSGYIIYIDRAWNTWSLRTVIPPKLFYPVKLWPQNRGKRWTGFVYWTNWIIILHNIWDTWIVATWRVETEGSWYWWAMFASWFILSWIYDMDFQWVWTHIQYITWIVVYDRQTLIDFTSWAKRWATWFVKWDAITYFVDYQNISASTTSNFPITLSLPFVIENTLFASTNLMISDHIWQLNSTANTYIRSIPDLISPAATWRTYLRWEILNTNTTNIKNFWFSITNSSLSIIQSWSFISTELIAWDLQNWDGVRDQCINMLDSAQISSIMFNSSNTKPFNYVYPSTDFNWDDQTTVTDFALYLVNQFRWDGCLWWINSISK